MKENKISAVNFVLEKVLLVDQRLLIEACDDEEMRMVALIKWEADLKQHKFDYVGCGAAWIAHYKHSASSSATVFKARSSWVEPSISEVLGSDVNPQDLASWLKNIDPLDAPRVMKAQVLSRDEFQPFNQRWRTWHSDTEGWRYVHAVSRAVWGRDPAAPDCFDGVIMDVTEHELRRRGSPPTWSKPRFKGRELPTV